MKKRLSRAQEEEGPEAEVKSKVNVTKLDGNDSDSSRF